MSIVRSVIAMALAKRSDLHQMDVKNAFLNGELQEEVYMEKPEGDVHLSLGINIIRQCGLLQYFGIYQ